MEACEETIYGKSQPYKIHKFALGVTSYQNQAIELFYEGGDELD